jgi:hypothetical protein
MCSLHTQVHAIFADHPFSKPLVEKKGRSSAVLVWENPFTNESFGQLREERP